MIIRTTTIVFSFICLLSNCTQEETVKTRRTIPNEPDDFYSFPDHIPPAPSEDDLRKRKFVVGKWRTELQRYNFFPNNTYEHTSFTFSGKETGTWKIVGDKLVLDNSNHLADIKNDELKLAPHQEFYGSRIFEKW